MRTDLFQIFHWNSLLFPLAILLPNLLFFRSEPTNIPDQASRFPLRYGPLLEIVEWAGRLGMMVGPLFFTANFSSTLNKVALVLAVISLMTYYLCWARYFLNGRDYGLLFSPLARIPVPMAVAPILFMLSVAKMMNSYLLFAFVVLFSMGHIPISAHEHRICERANSRPESVNPR